MKVGQVKELCIEVMDEVGRTIVGKREVLERVMICVLADGHLLFEDYPGLAKTMIANCFAKALGCDFKRVQFTPDLLPADITGSFMLDRNTGTFNLRRGPVFTNVLLADEINRAPPKTQAALLEAMQERQVTLEGETHRLTQPFIVMATQNPIEYEGTYPLPEAQIDRFLMRTSVGYPSKEEEALILLRRKTRGREEPEVSRITGPEEVLACQRTVETVHIEDDEERAHSYWARVATLMAGKKRGTFIIPEVDDEVLVAFEHGQIDRPVVIGMLWNSEDQPPVMMDARPAWFGWCRSPGPGAAVRPGRERGSRRLVSFCGSNPCGLPPGVWCPTRVSRVPGGSVVAPVGRAPPSARLRDPRQFGSPARCATRSLAGRLFFVVTN